MDQELEEMINLVDNVIFIADKRCHNPINSEKVVNKLLDQHRAQNQASVPRGKMSLFSMKGGNPKDQERHRREVKQLRGRTTPTKHLVDEIENIIEQTDMDSQVIRYSTVTFWLDN